MELTRLSRNYFNKVLTVEVIDHEKYALKNIADSYKLYK